MASLMGIGIGAGVGALVALVIRAARKRRRYLDAVAKGMEEREQRKPDSRLRRAIYFPKEFRSKKDHD